MDTTQNTNDDSAVLFPQTYTDSVTSWDNFTNEKTIEVNFYATLLNVLSSKGFRTTYSSQYNIDGLVDVQTNDNGWRILIEAKRNREFTTAAKDVHGPLSQALSYTRTLDIAGELIPAVIVLLGREQAVLVETTDVIDILASKQNWGITPSALWAEKLLDEHTIAHHDYSLTTTDGMTTLVEHLERVFATSPFRTTRQRNYPALSTHAELSTFVDDIAGTRWWDTGTEIYQLVGNRWATSKPTEFVKVLEAHGFPRSLMSEARRQLTRTCSAFATNDKLVSLEDGVLDLRTGLLDTDATASPVTSHVPVTWTNHKPSCCTAASTILATHDAAPRTVVAILSDKEHLDAFVKFAHNAGFSVSTNAYVPQPRRSGSSGAARTIYQGGLNHPKFAQLHETYPLVVVPVTMDTSLVDLSFDGCGVVPNSALEDESAFRCWLLEGEVGYLTNNVTTCANCTTATEGWRETGDNIRSWFNECLAIDGRSYCLNEDLRDSYNNWLEKHGYNTLSHKVFLDRFENHDIFIQNQFALVRTGRALVGTTHSSWTNPKTGTTRNTGSGVMSHTRGIRFA